MRTLTFGTGEATERCYLQLADQPGPKSTLFGTPSDEDFAFVDVDDTITEVHGHQKQDSVNGCSALWGLNTVLATASDTLRLLPRGRKRG